MNAPTPEPGATEPGAPDSGATDLGAAELGVAHPGAAEADAAPGRPPHSYDILPRLHPLVPRSLIEVARTWGPGRTPVVPRPSASVVIVREGTRFGTPVLQTYLMQRQATMPFAPLMSVFPGGAVDPADDPRDPLLFCALRETEEETGLRLEPVDLHPWARWITPIYAPMRFDTVFYLAVCPADQEPQDISGETDTASWWDLSEILEAAELGALALMPPTLSVVLELADCSDVSAVLARARDRVVAPVSPELSSEGGTFSYRYPSTP